MFKWLFGKKEEAADVGGTAEIIVINRQIRMPIERAFAVFVDELHTWWPSDLTWAKERLDRIGIEPKIGGHGYERDMDGNTSIWGTVLSMKRPEHIVLAWQIRPDRTAEPSEAAASRVDARFVAVDRSTTDLILVHRDFPRHGEGWQAYRSAMASKQGWPRLIQAYAKTAGGA